ncbi:MAG: polymer-forming cytoskeletal protein [Candidatus Portnoybacteria bacterium]|nr:polymer-forming cytoskeletal protein [Candidatus Portnoybacteria bacterium]
MKKLFLALTIVLLVAPLAVSAAFIRGEQSYTLGKNETLDKNLYTAGSNVSLLGQAKQDAALAGGTLIISGSVGKDLTAAGGTILIDGDIGDDARMAGGTITINNKIGGELLAAGGQVTISSGAEIKGEARIASGDLSMAGNILGDLFAVGDTIRLDGKITGNVKVKASKKLTIGKNAEISGNLDYSAPEKLTMEDGGKILGQTTYKEFKPVKVDKKGWLGFLTIWWMAKMLMLMLAAVVVSLLIKKQLQNAVRQTLPNFSRELLRGFILLIVLPVAIIISFITIIGLALGGMALLLYILMACFSAVYAAIVLGALVSKYIFKTANYEPDWKTAIIGVLILTIIGFIPFVGWLFYFVFFLVAFGSLFNFFYQHFRAGEK